MIRDLLNPTNLRYERKFLISGVDRYGIESIVKQHPAIFIERYPERCVNNIYLDTHSMSNYFDNVDGLSERLKVRIRWYGDLFGVVKNPVLELKIKKGFLGGKNIFPLKSFCLNEKYSLNKQQDMFASSDMPNSLIEYLKPLKFALLNRYCRKYYESSDHKFRITIDFNMEFYKLDSANNSFNEKFVDFNNTVLELKYSDENDDFAESISNFFPFRVTKSSKYVSGIDKLYQY